MVPGHRRLHRWLLLASVVAWVLAPLASANPLHAIAQFEDEQGSLAIDLAAIAINPLDLAVLSLPGAAIANGQYLSEQSASLVIARSYRKPLDAARGLVSGNGFQRGYTLTNEIVESGDTNGPLRIASTLLVSSDPDSARALYRALTETAEKGVTVVSDETVIGDASQVVSYTTDASVDGVIMTMQITVRSGSWVTWASVSAHELPRDARDLVASIGGELLRKVELIQNGGSPRISYQALVLQGVNPTVAAYVGSAGAALPLYGESESAVADREERYAGVTITYREEMDIPSDAPGLRLAVEISGFEYFDAAAAWIGSAADRQRQIPGASDIEVDDAIDPLGDASTSLTYRTDDGRRARQVSVLSGPYTVTIDLTGVDVPPASVLETLAHAQLRCLQSDSVCAAISIPDELSPVEPTVVPAPTFPPAAHVAATPVVVTPTVAPSPTPTATSIPSPTQPAPLASLSTPLPAADTLSYVDPDYPFAITYASDQWHIEQQGATNNRNFVLFGNGTSQIYLIAGRSYGSDVASCLDDAAHGLEREAGVREVAPAVNKDGQAVAGSNSTDAFAVYTYVRQDGEPMARYLKCMVLESGESTLLIMQIVPVASFNDEIAPRSDLLNGLEISTPS